MREERGQIKGDIVIKEPYTLWGSIGGDVKVAQHGKFYCRGNIYGNLTIEPGGRAHIFGNILGNLIVMEDTKVIHSGTISGDVTNLGGRLFVELAGKITGKIKTKSGDTRFEEKPGLQREQSK
jgi:cytoskeletal protein CcmA (bactofilin family)